MITPQNSIVDTENIAVTKLREFLRIETNHPNPDYKSCRDWLVEYGTSLSLFDEINVIEPVEGKPFVVFTKWGVERSLRSVCFYTHYDVVDVYPEKWTHHPFSAHKDEQGNIYARGAQDTKELGIQYAEALRQLYHNDAELMFLRTVHMLFGPDEENSSPDGMAALVDTEQFRRLNIGLMMDEGFPRADHLYQVFNREKTTWSVQVKCTTEQPLHASLFPQDSAMQKAFRVAGNFMAQRDVEMQKKLQSGGSEDDTLTINCTLFNGGIQGNIIPSEVDLYFHLQVPPNQDYEALERDIDRWIVGEGSGITYHYIQHRHNRTFTPVEGSKWFDAFQAAMAKAEAQFVLKAMPAATDGGRYVRPLGTAVLNFTPLNRTTPLAHGHDEYVNEARFLRGVRICTRLVPALANVPAFGADLNE